MLKEVKQKRSLWDLGLKVLAFFAIVAAVGGSMAGVALAGSDPTGAAQLAEDAGAPIDYTWVLMCAFLVFLMQAGFALLEAGFCRAKNATNLMMKNMLDLCFGSIAYMMVGFALMFGADKMGLFGTTGWFLVGDDYSTAQYLLYMFQVVFAATAATIVSGGVAERLKFKAYFIYSIILSAFIYPIYGHWVWGGGWLSGLGHLDFAGSGVVHAVGGWIALAGAMVLGPRIGRFTKDGKPIPIIGHSSILATLGCFILWFGWFGFNPGSTLSAHELRISVIAVNTNLAAAAGAIAAMFWTQRKTGIFDIGMTINGALAGLVAVTAPCAWVQAWSSVVIGIIAGVLVCISVAIVEKLKIDDPVGAFSVHGANGIWGLIAVGLFADGTYNATGLFYGGGFTQLKAQLIGAAVCIAWSFGLGYVLFKVLDGIMGIRVSAEEELEGLDLGEHGSDAYPDFVKSSLR
jgi:ammonium transporter, Amt family